MKTLNIPVRIALSVLFFYLIAAGDIQTSVQKMHGDLENTNCYDSKDLPEHYNIKWTFQTESSKINFEKFFDEEGNLRSNLAEIYSNDIIAIYDDMLKIGSILSTPNIDNGVVYFGSTDNYIYALH